MMLTSREHALLIRLSAITKGCSHDMHEPDGEGVTARVIGDHLDNAFGSTVTGTDHQELLVVITKEGHGADPGREEFFNLADLIAIARKAHAAAVGEGLQSVVRDLQHQYRQLGVTLEELGKELGTRNH